LNHLLLLSTYYFFPICCTIPNYLKFFKHIANLPWRMNPKSYNHFGHFFYTNGTLWNATAQFFTGPKKGFYVNSNTNILQSTWWKILKFFPHLLKQVYYKILQLNVSKKVLFQKFGTCTRHGEQSHHWECFWWKHCLQPLGVNPWSPNQNFFATQQFWATHYKWNFYFFSLKFSHNMGLRSSFKAQ